MLIPTLTDARPAIMAAKELCQQDLVALEIGVQNGDNAESMLLHLPIKELWLVDIWDKYTMIVPKSDQTRIKVELSFTKQLEVVKHKFENDKRIHIIRALSEIAVRQFGSDFFNFIYIDACHDYKMVSFDIEAWWPKMASGGIFSGHDYHSEWPGVIAAVDEFAKKNHVIVQFNDRDWWVIK